MNKRERFLAALEHREPDRVPIGEMAVDIPILEKITGMTFRGQVSLQAQISADRGAEIVKRDMEIICSRKYFDFICVDLSAPDGFEAKENPDGTRTDEWGRILGYDEAGKAWSPLGSMSIFKTVEDVENFEFPDPHAPGRTFGIEYVMERVKGELGVTSFIRDPFCHVWEVLGPMTFVRWMYEEPRALDLMFDHMTRFNIEMIKRMAELGVDLIVSGGDYAEEKGPFVPLKFFREKIFPRLKEQVDAAHRYGVPFIKHSDGNVMPLLEDLSKIVDGVHSLDPSAGIDIGVVKERFGDKLILIGNVSVDNLAKKSKDEIVEETKECIRKAAPGGGYILSSSNSWYAGCKLENCIAMVETGWKYGRYPIEL